MHQFFSAQIQDWESVKKSLSFPPLVTFLRIEAKDGLAILQDFIDREADQKGWKRFEIQPHTLPNIFWIQSRGPFDISPSPIQVIVDVLCGNAVLRGADIFKSGILACNPIKVGDVVSIWVDVQGKCLRGQTSFEGQKVFIGNGIAQVTREIFKTPAKGLSGQGVGILMTNTIFQTPCLSNLFSKGISLQNLPSILVGFALDVHPHHKILDMCCCPGGKTTHISNLTNNEAVIVALDRSKRKIEKFRQHCPKNVLPFVCDSTSCVLSKEETAVFSLNSLKLGTKIKGLPREYFDRILVDGPCSGLGQRPNFRCTETQSSIKELSCIQRSLLHAAYKLLKPGGRLVFSTCTITKMENQNNVAEFLNTFPDMRLVTEIDDIDWQQNAHMDFGCLFLPHVPCSIVHGKELDSIGFFFAVFIKSL